MYAYINSYFTEACMYAWMYTCMHDTSFSFLKHDLNSPSAQIKSFGTITSISVTLWRIIQWPPVVGRFLWHFPPFGRDRMFRETFRSFQYPNARLFRRGSQGIFHGWNWAEKVLSSHRKLLITAELTSSTRMRRWLTNEGLLQGAQQWQNATLLFTLLHWPSSGQLQNGKTAMERNEDVICVFRLLLSGSLE